MVVNAETYENALSLVKDAITDNRIFTFCPNSAVRLGCIQVKDIQSHFSIEKVQPELLSPSSYSIVFEDEDEVPTRPGTPHALEKNRH